MRQSHGFNGDWFLAIAQNWAEGPRVDFKSQIPNLNTSDAKYKFMRHLIAFANVARRTGKPCWIFFGVDDKYRTLHDVGQQYPGKNTPRGWHNPDVSIHEKQEDGVAKVFRDIADDWIEPLPNLQHEYGEVNGVFVSYLEICPEYPDRPYRLKKHTDKAPAGTVFIRRGSSTLRLSADEAENLLPAKNVPYLDEQGWRNIIQPLQEAPFADAYFLFQDFPLSVEATHENALAFLRQKLKQGQKIIHVAGIAGQGKSVLLHALAYDLAMEHNLDALTFQAYFAEKAESGKVHIDDLEVHPLHPVPIFLHLRTAFESTRMFEKRLVQEMGVNTELWASIQPFFRIPGSRWVLILDALDELHNREDFVPHLNEWLRLLPDNVQVILSARPYQPAHPDADTVSIKKLSESEIYALFNYYLEQEFAQLAILLEQDTTLDVHDLSPLRKEIDKRWFSLPVFSIVRTPRAVKGLLKAIFQDVYSKIGEDENSTDGYSENVGMLEDSQSDNVDHEVDSEVKGLVVSQEILIDASIDGTVSLHRDELDNANIIGVQFHEGGKIYYFDASGIKSGVGIDDMVLVETVLGQHVGQVVEFLGEPIDAPPGGWKPALKVVSHKSEQEFLMPTDAVLLKRVVNYLREKEKDRQKILGKNPLDLLEMAQADLDRLAWEKDWNDDTFNWYANRGILRDESKRWNEYIGFITRTSRRYWYRFLSVHLQALCAAEYALDMKLSMEIIYATIDSKREQRAAKIVVDFVNQLYQSNVDEFHPIKF